VLSFAAKTILFSTGWIIDKNLFMENYKKVNKAVLIYPHSSYLDFIIYSLYYYAYGLYDIYTIVTERFVPFPMLTLSLIPAPDCGVRHYSDKGESRLKSIYYAWRDKFTGRKVPTEYKRANFVETLNQKMSNLDNFKILISPTGSITDQTWKSGYYNIAKSLDIPIVICGVDYYKRRLICKNPESIEEYSSKDSEQLNRKFQDIASFHNSEEAYVFNTTCIISAFFFLTNYYKLFDLNILLIFLHTLGYFCSCLHYSNDYRTRPLSSICKALISIYLFIINVNVPSSLLLFASNIFYNFIDIYVNTEEYNKRNKFFYDMAELIMGVSMYVALESY
jgi:hypothetical protein